MQHHRIYVNKDIEFSDVETALFRNSSKKKAKHLFNKFKVLLNKSMDLFTQSCCLDWDGYA